MLASGQSSDGAGTVDHLRGFVDRQKNASSTVGMLWDWMPSVYETLGDVHHQLCEAVKDSSIADSKKLGEGLDTGRHGLKKSASKDSLCSWISESSRIDSPKPISDGSAIKTPPVSAIAMNSGQAQDGSARSEPLVVFLEKEQNQDAPKALDVIDFRSFGESRWSREQPAGMFTTNQQQELTSGSKFKNLNSQRKKFQTHALLVVLLDLAELNDVNYETASLLMRGIHLLCYCAECPEDVCSVLAHASAYYVDVRKVCGARMNNSEAGRILSMLMFLAHGYVIDEALPLSKWHKSFFNEYCTLDTLNKAILRVMQMRGYILRVDRNDLEGRYASLCRCCESL